MNNKFGIIAIVIAIIALILASAAVVLNREPGPEGPQGLTGPQGKQGIHGINGINGTDAPVNKLPTVGLVTQSGDFVWVFPSIINSCKYTYNIVVNVEDKDDENLKISFYWTNDSSKSWNLHEIYYGGDGDYRSTIVFKYCNMIVKAKTLYWLVEVWDGSDIVTDVYSYTITP